MKKIKKNVNLNKMRKELMSLVDTESSFEMEIVERYVNLVKMYRDLDDKIAEEGYDKIVKNGSQTFTKIHDAVGEKYKANQQLMKLGEFFERRRTELDNAKKSELAFDPAAFLK